MTMREKMARAIRAKWIGADNWERAGDGSRERFFELADAALDALMEPTSGMVDAAEANEGHYPAEARVHWEAMIRAAKVDR